MAAGASAASAAATEHSDTTPLSQLLNQGSGQAGAYELKVVRAEIVDYYTYTWQGKQIATQKVQVLLQSHNPIEYCLGLAKLQKKNKRELQQVLKRFAVDTHWRFTAVKLLDDTPLHHYHYPVADDIPHIRYTTCHITIDLRKTTAMAMLQSTPLPRTPCPVTTIADILELKPMQRSSAAHVHATEQDLPTQPNRHEADLAATTAEKGLVQFATMRENVPLTSTTYPLLLYWACSRPVARVHMATVSQRRACKGLRATWTLQCMTQLCRYDLPACRGCGFYPTSATCSNCCTAWCHSCRAWSALCWKCYRPRHSLADTGEFIPGFGGPGGNGSFDTPLWHEM